MLRDLPPEILFQIFKSLKTRDLIALHSTCTELHEVLDAYIYSRLRALWSALSELETNTRILKFTKELTAYAPDSTGEWRHSRQLTRIFALAPQLETLIVDCKGASSAWLKYIGPLPLTCLKLRANGGGSLFLFDFEHIATNFTRLQSLELHGFQLLPALAPLPQLETLALDNCTWEYPMHLGEVGDLKQLSIEIHGVSNPFAYSERLIHDTTYLPPNLEKLKLHLDISHRVNWRPLRLGAPKLKSLDLAGFDDFRIDKLLLPALIHLASSRN